jgi:hypothetical protein
MSTEYWGTFSIYDYQTPRYKQSLVLFDKVVIPLPTEPIGNVTAQEIERLSAEVDYLEKEGAAVGVKWDRDAFELWQEAHAAEAIAQLINNDRQLATRMQVQESVEKGLEGKFSVPGIEPKAVPIYADWSQFDSAWQGWQPARAFDIVARELALPDNDVPLEAIVALRGRKSFSESMKALRYWQDRVILDLLKSGENKPIQEATVRNAVNDLEKWMRQYQSALEDAHFKKVSTAVVSVLAMSAALATGAAPLIVTLAAVAPQLVNFRDVMRPSWQSQTNLECAPVGVIYEAANVLR